MSGSSCADASISMTGSIVAALNQQAEVRLVALDIKGAFCFAQVIYFEHVEVRRQVT